jgi:ABC-2 type transport system permease protein
MSTTILKSPFVTLMKREFWEHKALWMAPLITAGVFLVLALVGALFAEGNVHISPNNASINFEGKRGDAMTIGVYAGAMQLFLVAGVVLVVYLLDCLYAERKDRSIQFWKSLPVSDWHTVLAKYLVALVVVPLGVYALAFVVSPIIYAIAAVGSKQLAHLAQLGGGWDLGRWMAAQVGLLGSVLVSMLWFAPGAAWMMLASVYSRRMPLLTAVGPWAALAMLEGIVFQTKHVLQLVGSRFVMIADPLEGLTRPGMWIGLAVAAGMLYIVVRLRRYRDDT